ncbi:protein of unknown function [Pseudodesulfovibrio profundus]|uniref:Uncharacterized protein n=1 Tax=Pseudodesulfovibrio profundus TaxID=57320 RepID=A0A2C8FDB8_9BACT|nr:protein of unknown function [Pseudodesulfovibrio profundus]
MTGGGGATGQVLVAFEFFEVTGETGGLFSAFHMHRTEVGQLALSVRVHIGVTVGTGLGFVGHFVFVVTGEAVNVFVTGVIENDSEVTITFSCDIVDLKIVFRGIDRCDQFVLSKGQYCGKTNTQQRQDEYFFHYISLEYVSLRFRLGAEPTGEQVASVDAALALCGSYHLASVHRCEQIAVVVFRLCGAQVDDTNGLGVCQVRIRVGLLHFLQTLLSKGDHVFTIAEVHGAGGAALNTGGKTTGLHAIQAHVALGPLAGFLVHAGYVVRAQLFTGDGVTDGCRAAGHDNSACLCVLLDTLVAVHVTDVLAGRFDAVAALLREEVPLELAIGIVRFMEADKADCLEGQVLRVLVGADIACLFGREVFPLLTGYLTTAAGGTKGQINKEAFTTHYLSPSFHLRTLTMNALYSGIPVFGSPTLGVTMFAESPPSTGITQP